MSDHTAFLNMFAFCEDLRSSCGGLDKSYIKNVQVTTADSRLRIEAYFAEMPAIAEIDTLCSRIAETYGLSKVEILPEYPKAAHATAAVSAAGGRPAASGDVLFGRAIRQKPVPMSTVTLESGRVTVEGDVFAVGSKTTKSGGAVLNFDMTDKTNSVKISRFIRADDDKSIVDKINPGDHLIVQGTVSYSKYDDDMVIDPLGIVKGKKVIRTDDAEEKRVELHLHTRFSAMDALTDPDAVVKRAAYWGMPAIAVTDHGVAQAFPDLWTAGKKHGVKIIYGLEAYYLNDMDGSNAVNGKSDLPLATEYCAFDIETTGLNAINDRITEIGAVIIENGEVKKSFNTFVNPHMPIPERIVELTGIRDSDVANAPEEAEAVQAFLEFAGKRPLIAHNAHFDIGFIRSAALRSGIKFEPVFIDTLALSRSLLKGQLKVFKLDTVSNHLGLPKFNHHRASDDALVCGRIFCEFIPLLKEHGARTVNDIETVHKSLYSNEKGKTHHMVMLVLNKKGLKNLYEMISQSYLKYFHKNPTIPKSLILQHREGLLIGNACESGDLYSAIVKGSTDAELEKIAEFYDYLEIQPLCNNQFLVDNGTVKDRSVLEDYNRKIIQLGKKLGKMVIAASDVHFLDAEDEQYRKILLATKKFADADKDMPIYFRNTNEMLQEFMYLGEETAREVVITNTRAIADMVEPIELLPKDLFPPKIENSAQQLKDLVYGKMCRIYGENPPDIVKSRVDIELNTILDHSYDVIYMSAQKLVQNSLENGYLVGSRGSVGSSIVAYMSGITEVNSLPPHYVCPKCCHSEFVTDGSFGCGADMPPKDCPSCGTRMRQDGFDIPFETFLGYPGNEKTPDIDLNFSGEYQGKAHKYTEVLFGSDHVFRAGTIGTLAEKTAYGYVKKYLEERGRSVSKAEENRLSAGLVGIKRTTGQHPGGLVVIPQDMDVTDFCPVQHPADDPDSDIITTHFEYHCMEANLLKLDELGHDDPTMIRMLEDATGVNAQEILLSDPDTLAIFTSPSVLGLPVDDPIIGQTGTLGIPEFGTNFTRQMLVETQPKQFDTLIRLSGFSHGTDVWAGNIRDLIVSGTAGVNETVGCRDDIMLFLIAKGMEPSLAFKTMEAVRKGKVKKSGEFPGDAEQKMRDLGVPDWYIESCRKIAYLFPKAHAVAYVMMAFRIAWFKVHKPIAFYSAYFYRRSQKGGFSAELMQGGAGQTRRTIENWKRRELSANEEDLLVTLEAVYEFNMRGLEFLPVDLYKSDAIKFKIEDDTHIRLPFVSISGLGLNAAMDLERAGRSGQQFISIEELGAVCPKVSQTHLEQLKAMGALGKMPDSSQISFFDM
ncbi:MAG: PolC-type DNA polymerase III [Oscillospiraceae bacterium]|nr:PolC-type DNA polymerase III [Oscillospiraceae bacterium]